MYQYQKNFSGESDEDCKDCPRELWFGQGSVVKSHKYINITIFYLVKVTMTVKTAPENFGLVKVQLSNLKNVSISHFFLVKVRFSYPISKIYQYQKTFSGESDDDCKDCPRELWFGQGSVIKSHKYINITIFYLVKVTMPVKTAPENSGLVKVQLSNLKKYQYHSILSGESDDDCKDCPRELWFGQGSGIKFQKDINITIFLKDCSENSGLVKVQLSNLTNISISQNSIW